METFIFCAVIFYYFWTLRCIETLFTLQFTIFKTFYPSLFVFFLDFSASTYLAFQNNRQKSLELSYKKAILKNFAIFTGKRLYWSLFLIKFQSCRPATSLKRDSNTFPVNIVKFLKTLILKDIYEQLLVNKVSGPCPLAAPFPIPQTNS